MAQMRLAVEIAGRYFYEALAEERLERLEAAAERLQSLAGEKRFEAVLAAHALDLISVLPSNLPEELERLRIKREQENDFEGW